MLFQVALLGFLHAADAAGSLEETPITCGKFKDMYKSAECCGAPDKEAGWHVLPKPPGGLFTTETNPCNDKKPKQEYFNNKACRNETTGDVVALEQAGANITKGYKGLMETNRVPIQTPYFEQGLCPVNVHWHLGSEHLSTGQFDETGKGPGGTVHEDEGGEGGSRRLAVEARLGHRCHHYDENNAKFTTPYNWSYCQGMHVGETYEVHWPHSAAGMCGTPWQFQTPFYDGVFCRDGIISLDPLNTYQKIGVEGQVFTIINDEEYYYPDLMRGMIVQGDYGADIAKYTGSTTGTSRDNEVCSWFTPITWQVDRKCHLISASSFDKMCHDMLNQLDDMLIDIHPHGSRETVEDHYAPDTFYRV